MLVTGEVHKTYKYSSQDGQGGRIIKILVTGGAGFIASHLNDCLLSYGHDIVVVDDLSSGKLENINPRAKFYHLNINDSKLDKVLAGEKPQLIYHFAAQVNVGSSQQDPLFDANSNIMGTIKILNYAVKHNAAKIIFASSAAIYGNPAYLPLDEKHQANPLSFYGLSKYTAEGYIRLFSRGIALKYSILRFANVYGPRQQSAGEGGVIAQFISRYGRGDSLNIYGDGEQTRDFIYVADVVAACCKALDMGDNQTVNISTGDGVSINRLWELLDGIIGCQSRPLYGPRREGDIIHSVLDNSKARNVLLWGPRITLREGLERTLRYAENDNTN